MPRTKGSKNKPKTVTADFVTQIAEKKSVKETLSAEIASLMKYKVPGTIKYLNIRCQAL